MSARKHLHRLRFGRLDMLAVVVTLLAGCEDQSDPIAPSFARAGTASLSTSTTSADRISLSWPDDVRNEAGWEIHRSTTGATGTFALLDSLAANSTAYDDAGLTARTQYCYKVRSFRKQGSNTSYAAFTNVSCSTTLAPPAAPTGLAAVPRSWGTIDIAWTDNANDEQGFRIERAAASAGPWTNLGSTSANTLSFQDQQPPGLEQPACYRVIAVNSVGDSPASNVACTARPTPPSGLSATATASDVELMWTDNSGVEDGFEIRRWTVGVATVIAIVPANTTAYRDAGLPDDTYWYQVRARRDGGDAGSSNNAGPATVLTSAPIAPSSVSAVPGSSTRATVVWVDNSTNESGFLVKRSTDGGASWVIAGWARASDPYFYTETYFYDEGQPSEPQLLCYSVIAVNSLGESAPSNTDCTTLPLGPSGLTLTEIDGTTIDFAWTDNSSIEDGYELRGGWESCDEEGCGTIYYPIATLAPNTTSHRASGLDSFAYYQGYVVVAIKEGGGSDPSNTTVPVPISNLVARADSPGRIDLAWTNKLVAEWVWIERCQGDAAACASSGFFLGRGYAPRYASTFADTTVEAGVTYTYRAYTYHADINRYSAPSSTASATSQ